MMLNNDVKHYFELYAKGQVLINVGKFWQSVHRDLMNDVDKAHKILHIQIMFECFVEACMSDYSYVLSVMIVIIVIIFHTSE